MTDYYSHLLEWRRAEAAARGLAKLPADFYSTSRSYLDDARRTFESELRENPAGRKGEVARQTFQRASQVARDIVEARMTKILSSAFQASVGGSKELGHSLPEERTLYDELVLALLRHRSTVAPFLPTTTAAPPAVTPPAPPAASPPAPKKEAAASAAPRGREETAVVRILKDQKPIETHGETLDLRKEDVLSVPTAVARTLVAAKVAELVAGAGPAPTT